MYQSIHSVCLHGRYTPIVVSTVEEKNTACNILHFSSSAGKLFVTSNARPLPDASSKTYKGFFIIIYCKKLAQA